MRLKVEKLEERLRKQAKEVRFDTTDDDLVLELCNYPKRVIEKLAEDIEGKHFHANHRGYRA